MSNQPKGCDPCSYPECGCAYSQDDPRRADAMSDKPARELLPGEAEVDSWIDTLEQRADAMSEFTQYRRKHIAELRPYIPGEDIWHVSVSDEDVKAGSPKEGDMIARNPKNHDDQWLVAAQYFADNFEPSEG